MAISSSLLGLAGLFGAGRGGWVMLGTASVAVLIGSATAFYGLLL